MCGIVGYTGIKKAAEVLLDGLEKLEYRGYDSAGMATLFDKKIWLTKTTGRIASLKEKTDNGASVSGNIGVGHTRWATHGAPTNFNAHPHISGDGKFALVHNGIIENYLDLKAELKAEGVRFTSDTDTEVIPKLIEKYYEGDFLTSVSNAVRRLRGSYALGIICSEYPDTLIAVRNFSPLIIGKGEGENLIASDVTALVNFTKDVIYIDDGDIAVLSPESVTVYDKNLNPVTRQVSKITWDLEAAEKGGYDHFMMKEIMEQPRAVSEAVERRIKDSMVDLGEIKLKGENLKKFTNISIIACGSAYHAGIVGKYVLEKMTRLPVNVDLASEYRYRDPVCSDKTLAIIVSQSGETADTLAALCEAKSRGAYILSIVNVVGSSIASKSDDVIYTYAGPEIAVATTKGYSTQLAVFYLLSAWIAKKLGTVEGKELQNFINGVRSLPELIEFALEHSTKQIEKIAKECAKNQSLFFIGRNVDYAVSLEASLKLKEISYIHSEAYAAGELKHGTISLIEEGKIVFALCCNNRLTEKMISNIKEVTARGARVFATATRGQSFVEEETDEVIFLPKTHELLLASVEVIPYQLLAYFVTIENGYDVDKPRNLAKSVTVE